MATSNQRTDPQHHSTELSQGDLFAARPGARVVLDRGTILRQPSFHAVLMLCVASSGLVRKQVFDSLGIDKATWSRIESGDANFPPEKLTGLMAICGNQAPLTWLAERCGYDWSTIRPRTSDQDRRIAELERENADLQRAVKLIVGAKA